MSVKCTSYTSKKSALLNYKNDWLCLMIQIFKILFYSVLFSVFVFINTFSGTVGCYFKQYGANVWEFLVIARVVLFTACSVRRSSAWLMQQSVNLFPRQNTSAQKIFVFYSGVQISKMKCSQDGRKVCLNHAHSNHSQKIIHEQL